MNVTRTAFSVPKRLFPLPHCTIVVQLFSTTANYSSKLADSVFNSWRDLVKNPADWCDYREDKSVGLVKEKYPDFKHKTSRVGLWLNSAPNSVLAGLEGLNVRKRNMEDCWKDLVENPDKWFDNRPTKTKVNAPDFKHKETNEGLWLHSSPKWVLALLDGLNVGLKEDSWKNLVENPGKWLDVRLRKTNVNAPDFIHKETYEALWLDSSPNWVLTVLEGLNVGKRRKEYSWNNLVENPEKWWDNRPRKAKENSPDFTHKETSEALWLKSSPKWVLAMLERLDVGKWKKDDSWKNLLENPDKWWDKRSRKINLNAPDFKHKETDEGLWLDSAPKWVLERAEGLNVGKGKKDDSWKNFLENPDKWWDNRSRKINVNVPDFKHKETNEGLWLDNAPKWVLERGEGLNVGKGKKEDSWKNLVENRDKWLDNRPRKTNVNMPNFKHKETNEGLWLSNCPKWVLSQLPC